MSKRVLVEHNTTPTGFGIMFSDEHGLRALSPCCGKFIRVDGCGGCGDSYGHFSMDHQVNVEGWLDMGHPEMAQSYSSVFSGWATRLLGTEAKLEVSFS